TSCHVSGFDVAPVVAALAIVCFAAGGAAAAGGRAGVVVIEPGCEIRHRVLLRGGGVWRYKQSFGPDRSGVKRSGRSFSAHVSEAVARVDVVPVLALVGGPVGV